jgi:hypothetical protein
MVDIQLYDILRCRPTGCEHLTEVRQDLLKLLDDIPGPDDLPWRQATWPATYSVAPPRTLTPWQYPFEGAGWAG